MRKFRFSKPLLAEDEAQLLAFWASLSSSSPQLDEPAIHQHLVNDQARFVISLARQHISPSYSFDFEAITVLCTTREDGTLLDATGVAFQDFKETTVL